MRATDYPLTPAGIAQAWIDLDTGADCRQSAEGACLIISGRVARTQHAMPGALILMARVEPVEWPRGSRRYIFVQG